MRVCVSALCQFASGLSAACRYLQERGRSPQPSTRQLCRRDGCEPRKPGLSKANAGFRDAQDGRLSAQAMRAQGPFSGTLLYPSRKVIESGGAAPARTSAAARPRQTESRARWGDACVALGFRVQAARLEPTASFSIFEWWEGPGTGGGLEFIEFRLWGLRAECVRQL